MGLIQINAKSKGVVAKEQPVAGKAAGVRSQARTGLTGAASGAVERGRFIGEVVAIVFSGG
jgi:hypothetical protein